ncbi:MAG: multiprotein bridging factor aMBF1 [Nitrososphaerales archaeon]
MNCEVCGSNIRGEPQAVNLDGGIFRVCNTCARLGTPARVQKPVAARTGMGLGGSSYSGTQRPNQQRSSGPPPPPSAAFSYDGEEMILREDYSKAIKDAREMLGITQEDLGRKINEKPSMIGHLENGSMKPDDMLAKKLEHFLKIRLFIPEDETESELDSTTA